MWEGGGLAAHLQSAVQMAEEAPDAARVGAQISPSDTRGGPHVDASQGVLVELQLEADVVDETEHQSPGLRVYQAGAFVGADESPTGR